MENAVGIVYVDLSMSLDGFIAGPDVTAAMPMGVAGDRLHDWMFAGKTAAQSREWENQRFARTGALVMGRTMFDVGVVPWGEDPTFHAPVFVLTHRAGPPVEKRGGTTYTLVADGPDDALDRAQAAAGGLDVCIAGGATVVQHYLNSGQVDALRLHLVPVLLGDGVRLFEPANSLDTFRLNPAVTAPDGVVHICLTANAR